MDLYYSKFTRDETMRGLMGSVGDAWGGLQGAVFSNVVTQQVSSNTTLVTSANIAGVPNLVVRNDLNTTDDKLTAGGWNTEYKLGGGWTAVADLSYSNAKRQEKHHRDLCRRLQRHGQGPDRPEDVGAHRRGLPQHRAQPELRRRQQRQAERPPPAGAMKACGSGPSRTTPSRP